jgi:RimJ/RimL family protein N-acetyltransferase
VARGRRRPGRRSLRGPLTQHWLAHLPSPYQLADAQFYVRSREEQHATARGLYWCVADPDTDLCLASVALFGLTGSYPEPEVGYWAHPDARGRGAMTEATRLVLRHAVLPATDGGLGLRRVSLRAAAGNAASIAVADAAGMTRFGTARAAEQLRDGTVEDLRCSTSWQLRSRRQRSYPHAASSRVTGRTWRPATR